MRKCIRCQTEMIENCDIKVEGALYGIVIAKGENIFSKRIGKPKIAVCPKCGEISIYIQTPEMLDK